MKIIPIFLKKEYNNIQTNKICLKIDIKLAIISFCFEKTKLKSDKLTKINTKHLLV